MSRLRLNEITKPSVPAGSKQEIYADIADYKIKAIDDKGFVAILSPDGWRDQNLIINGSFLFAQRQVPTTLTSSTALAGGRQYAFDRWFQSNAGGSVIIQTQQVDNSGGAEAGLFATSYGKYKVTGAVSKLVIGQVIENANCNHLNSLTVRFSCRMKYSIASSMTVRLGLVYMTAAGTIDTISAAAGGFISAFNGTGADPTLTAAANLVYLTPIIAEGGTIVGNGMDCILTANWVEYSATFLIPPSAKNLIPMIWTNAALAANEELNISEAGLYAGEELRDWYPRVTALELSQCERYYFKTFNLLTAPAFQVLPGTVRWSCGVAGATSATWGEIKYRTRMRNASGTVAWYSPVTAANAFPYMFSATAGPCTAVAVANQHDGGFSVTTTPPATAVIGSNVGVQVTVDNEI